MLYQRGKQGIWWLKKMVDGQKINRSLHETNRRRAEKAAEEVVRLVRAGNCSAPTASAWWDRYLAVYTARKVKDGQKIDRRVRESVRAWDPRTLDRITPAECMAWQVGRLKTYASNTVRTERAVLSAFFEAAVKEGVLQRNPWKGLPRPALTHKSRVLEEEEERKLLRQLLPHHDVTARIILGTGLRMHEVLGLRSEDIRPEGLHVLGKGRKRRVVPLLPEVRELLAKPAERNHRVFAEALERAAQRAKLPHVTPHDLRRTFATRCALAGMPAVVLARIMGHSSIKMTEQYYVRVDERAALDALEKALGKRKVLRMAVAAGGPKVATTAEN